MIVLLFVEYQNRSENGAGLVVESGGVGGGSGGGVERVAGGWIGEGVSVQFCQRMVGEVRDLGDPSLRVAPHRLHRSVFTLCDLLRNRRSSPLRFLTFRLLRLLRQNPRSVTLLLHRQVYPLFFTHCLYYLRVFTLGYACSLLIVNSS